jgi:4-aminobutyrate aminotransferase/(S)-3-amino-2-methylpropionate transaminase
MMTLGLTGKVAPYKVGFGPFPGEVFHALYPNALHGVSVDDALQSVELLFKNDIEPERVAAFILEPVQGEGGFYMAPADFVEGLRALADRHGILIIADEVQTGAGRTGTWFASEQWPVAPDLITTAKSMAGGFPISGVVGRAEVMDAPAPGGLGGTYAGSPIGCAAALAVLKVFDDEQLLARSKALGERLMSGLRRIAAEEPAVGDVRGFGAMVAIELFEQGDIARPDAALTRKVVAEAARRGLILLSCGSYGNVIRVLVPLTASDLLVDEGLALLADSFAALR